MMESSESKYIFVNGVMKPNPNHPSNAAKSTVKDPKKALTVVSSTADIGAATQAQYHATGQETQLSESTVSSMQIMQDSYYTDKYQCQDRIDGGDVLDGLSNVFAKYEVPVGLINKLLALSEYHLNFVIDDSGSMTTVPSIGGMERAESTPYMSKRGSKFLSRWEEVEDRLHIMMEMLAYIPCNQISISFLNRSDKLTLDHRGMRPEEFAEHAHKQLNEVFHRRPTGGTPLYGALSRAFGENRSCNTMHYVLTDGEPSDRSISEVERLIMERDARKHPLNLISCTEDDSACNWMKEIEERAPLTAEIDDFRSEREEVYHDQGPAFPFTKGLWLVCNLVAAINPDDLDAIDEKYPFTKGTLDNLLGRKTTPQEYQHYFSNHPHSREYQSQYREFCREDIMAKQIVGKSSFGTPSPAPYLPSNQGNYGYGSAPAQQYGAYDQKAYTPDQGYGAPAQQGYGAPAQQGYGSSSYGSGREAPPPSYDEVKKSGYRY